MFDIEQIIDKLNIAKEDTPEQREAKIEAVLGVSIEKMRQALEKKIQEQADKLVPDLINVAPYGDYGNLIEDSDKIIGFLKEEASQAKNWKITAITLDGGERLGESDGFGFSFVNTAVDEGDLLYGRVFVGGGGEIRHVMVYVDDI